MRLSRGWLCAFFLAFTALVGSGSVAAADAHVAGGSHGPLSGGLMIEGAGLLLEGQSAAAEKARRANPEAVVARAVSADAYRGLSSGAAERLAGKSFPGLIAGRDGGVPRLPAGQRITGFASPSAAQVDLGGGEHALIDSTIPMAMKGSSGKWTPVDLGLHESGSGFEGADPLVAARLPKRLNEGAQLPGIGLSVTPVDAHGESLTGTASPVDGSSVFVANTLSDSDTVLKPSTLGFSIDTLLRSANSPQQLSFRIGLPVRARLIAAGSDSGAVQVVREGDTIAWMQGPSAHDAAGTNVPVEVRVSGDVVTLTIAHQAGDYLYPIVVDPEFNVTTGGSKHEAAVWPFTTSGGFQSFYLGGSFSEMVIEGGPSYAKGEWGALNYQTKGNTKLYEVNSTATFEGTEGNGTEYWLTSGEDYVEFAGAGGSEGNSLIARENVHLTEWPVKSKLCPWSVCAPEGGSANNTVRFVERATYPGSGAGFQLRVTSASVAIAQPKETHSTVSYNTSLPELEYTSGGKLVKTTNVFYGGGWIGPNSGAFEFKSEDAGLGVSGTNVSTLKSGVWTERVKRNYLTEGCVDVQCAAAQKETVSYSMISSGLVNGNNTIRVAAHDPMSATWSSEHGEGEANLKVDTAAPHGITLSGLVSKEGSYELDETVGHAKIEATDGEGSTPSSGIKSISLAIDGKEIGSPTGSCTPGPCVASREWNVNGGELGGGSHTLTVVATDNTGNVASATFSLYVYQASPVTMGPGTVDPESGNFALEASDVSMSGGEGALMVSRHHNSRNPQEGVEGPLGPQWTISLGSMASLEVLPDGSVMVVGPEGLMHFANKTGGGFQAPIGDTSLKLEAVIKSGKISAYLLKNPTTGTTTTFTLPSGAKSWMPTVSEGPVATNTTTDEYTTAEPEAGKKIVEPILEVAPHPSATCAYKKLEKGCRALEFNYAASTTASGEGQSEWGDYKGHLTRVYFIAWDPVKKEVTSTAVAQYSYDTQGRLRAEWDPRVSTPLKTIYGYDSEGRVTALTPPGQETWAFSYGPISGDTTSGRLLRTTRAPASAPLWSGSAPANTVVPTVTPEPLQIGVSESATAGTWSGSPVAYRYQWQRCNASGGECVAIAGASNEAYKPTLLDAGREIRVEVQATNGGGSTVAYSMAIKLVAAAPSYKSKFGTEGAGAGQLHLAHGVALDASGNVWVADTGNNRVEEFSSSGTFIRQFGTVGTANGQLKEPYGIAVTPEGKVWVVDTGNARVQEFSSTGEYLRQFGSEGLGAGQFVSPGGIAITPEGNIWVTDSRDYRVEEFSSAGTFIRQVGSLGTGNGQFGAPSSVAPDAYGDIWVVDATNNRVEELSATGEYIRQFGSAGTGQGQFKEPSSVAVDSTGGVWVTDRFGNRLQGFNAQGEYLTQYGSLGTENGQFREPAGLAVSGSGAIYVADVINARIQELVVSKSTLAFSSKFGSVGSEAGKLSWPGGVALDGSGNVWVADTFNNRIQEFTAAGVYSKQFGAVGTGNGQLKEPTGIAITPEGNIWVVDRGNYRIQEFEPNGNYVRQFGSFGSGSGQFYRPYGILISPETGHIWISDAGNNRVQEFSPTGEFVRQFGGLGSGNGQLKNPDDMAFGPEHNVWVADAGNNRMEEFSSTGAYIRQFGSYGAGRGQFREPNGIVTDGSGDIWVADTISDRIQGFSATGEFLAEYGGWGEGNGQFYDPNAMVVSKTGSFYVLDSGWGRVQQLTIPLSAPEPAATPRTEGDALTTIEYNVPVSGSGAPYAMSAGEASKWGQTDTPSVATAFFPADEPEGWPAQDYNRAAVYYMDSQARTTNLAIPGGGISTIEYNEYNDVVRGLSSANRAKALKEGAKSAEVAKLLDTESVFGEEGSRLLETVGPQHTVKIVKGNEKVPSGNEVAARDHTRYYYDEGAPATGETYNLVTKTTDGAETAGKEEFDVRTSTKSYSGQANLGWKLRTPTSTTTDPAGLKITHTTVYDEASGAVLETRGPASTGPGNTHDSQTVYYTAAANPSYPACGGHIEWMGLPCQTLPGKQPETSGLPQLPVATMTYNIWDEPETVTEAFGSTTRTKKTTFDTAGRTLTGEVTSTNDTATPAVTDHYDEKNGALVKQSETFEGKEKAITSEYNKLGDLSIYIDSDGGMTAYKYDIDRRPTEMTVYTPELEVRGKQTYSYDPTSGSLTKLVDSAAGTFTASYDVAGNLTSETYPNKMTATYTSNALGQNTGIEYSKTAYCATTCPENWFKETTAPSIHGEALEQSSTLSEEPKEVYDEAGRLLEVQEIPVGKGCTTRIYGYDEESNRTSLTTRAPGSEGKCSTEGGSAEVHTYDSANRLTDSGVSYETFGNVTKLPAADAGGAGMEVTSSYYVDNQLATQAQHGVTTNYYMDPAGRLRETRAPGVSVTHYADGGSAVSWVNEPESKWTRNIPGIDGSLSATQSSGGAITLQLHDLQGNVVGTAALNEHETKQLSTYSSTEFGVPVNGAPPKYAWLGADGLASESPTGLVVQNGITYVPQTGRPLQTQGVALPIPDNPANPYAMILSPWVVEGTAAVAKQLTNAEEARRAAEEAARSGGGGGRGVREIGGELSEVGGGGEASISIAGPSFCKVHWKLAEGEQGLLALSGWYKCEHKVPLMEIEVCLFWKYPGKPWSKEECVGGNGRGIVFKDTTENEVGLLKTCVSGLVYTGAEWAYEVGPHHEAFWSSGSIFSKDYPRLVCEGSTYEGNEELGDGVG